MANSLHEVGFTNADSAPNKEGVVGDSGVLDNALGGGVGIVVGVADDEIVKSVLGMKTRGEGGGERSIGKKR